MPSSTPGPAPVVHRADALQQDGPGVLSRPVNREPAGAWSGPVVTEWELTGAGWEDRHPHTELNVVLAGRLHVESGGIEVVLGPGDCVEVAAGATGRYWAPEYARMLAVYGPNPEGAPTPEGRSWQIATTASD